MKKIFILFAIVFISFYGNSQTLDSLFGPRRIVMLHSTAQNGINFLGTSASDSVATFYPGSVSIFKQFKTPNIVLQLLDTTNYKLEVVDVNGLHFKTNWPTFGAGTNIYNTDGALTANRSMSGAGFSLALGTSGSNLGGLSITGGKYNSTQGSQLLGAASTINNAVTSASGNVTNFSGYAFLAPTLTSTNTGVTYASPTTLYIDGPPVAGTNSTITGINYSLNVNSGIVHFGGSGGISGIFDGSLSVKGGTVSNAYNLSIGASTTANHAVHFDTGVDPTTTVQGGMWWNGTNLYFGDAATNKRDLLNGIHNYVHTIFTPTTGGTVSLVANNYNIINPAGALLALTVNLPSSPVNNDVVYIKFTQNVTTVTYGNGTVVDGITAPTAGGLTVLNFDGGTNSWY